MAEGDRFMSRIARRQPEGNDLQEGHGRGGLAASSMTWKSLDWVIRRVVGVFTGPWSVETCGYGGKEPRRPAASGLSETYLNHPLTLTLYQWSATRCQR